MKTKLLNQKNIWLFMLVLICYTSVSIAQNSSSNNSASDEMQGFKLEFITLDGLEISRELRLSFSSITSDGFDEGFDTKNLNVLSDDLNLVLDGELMNAQAYGPITEDKSVPLVLQSTGNYDFTIQLTSMENMGDQSIRLKDNYTESVYDLRSGDIFQFSSASGSFEDRFNIFFKSQTLSQSDLELQGLNLNFINGSNTMIINNPKNVKISNIEMYAVSGQMVENKIFENENQRVQYTLSHMTAGIYIVRVITETNSILTKKIIVN
ncbi:T9SS type A sorting domain-containing protein [Winogradskyella aquimaris]|uniref:T9SS type A sorting domain-containing protein n=1 Tax=Winogradskyella aquimaris TaxID=864074 RepID=A0ABU5EJB6_9FLAO|nr:T9SS type A sorting domain-containing protein [Winogradskyella aquimaris]MDY2586313.1 T9SS type A sorting domain-containing protein [Winogradskyella aquimaris]